MVDYRKLKIGDKVLVREKDFYGRFQDSAVVTEVYENKALADNGESHPMHYRIDDDTAELFFMDEKRETGIKVGDRILTPRFQNVYIKDVYGSEMEAYEDGYTETTNYKLVHDDGWNILGKSCGMDRMVFCAVRES